MQLNVIVRLFGIKMLIPENPLTFEPASLPAFAAAPPFFVAANKSRANEVKAVQEVQEKERRESASSSIRRRPYDTRDSPAVI